MKPLNRFKFYITPLMFRECSELYTSLDTALLKCTHYDEIRVIPSGHAPWKSKYPANDGSFRTSPLVDIYGWCWTVLEELWFKGETKPIIHYLGQFSHPFDAFAFAELKTKRAKDTRRDEARYYVCYWAYAENQCRPEIAKLPAGHLTALRQTRDRAERRRQRLAA